MEAPKNTKGEGAAMDTAFDVARVMFPSAANPAKVTVICSGIEANWSTPQLSKYWHQQIASTDQWRKTNTRVEP